MGMIAGKSSTLRHALLTLAFGLLFAVRLASPFGFMPGASNGQLALVECPDAGPAFSHHGVHHGDGDAKVKSICPFAAGAASAGPLPEPITAGEALSWPSFRHLFPIDVSDPIAGRVALRPPSRAPPQA